MLRLSAYILILTILSNPAIAQNTPKEFSDIIRSINVNGISMNSSVENIDHYFKHFENDENVTCQILKREPRTGRKINTPRQYTWSCNKHDAQHYEMSWRFSITYRIDRVTHLEYNGPLAPMVNNLKLPDAIAALNEKLENNSFIEKKYTHYIGWGHDETAKVYELFAHNENIDCAIDTQNEQLRYGLALDFKYNSSPDRPVSQIRLRDSYAQNCLK